MSNDNPVYTGQASVYSYGNPEGLGEPVVSNHEFTVDWSSSPVLVTFPASRLERFNDWQEGVRTRVARWIAPWLGEDI